MMNGCKKTSVFRLILNETCCPSKRNIDLVTIPFYQASMAFFLEGKITPCNGKQSSGRENSALNPVVTGKQLMGLTSVQAQLPDMWSVGCSGPEKRTENSTCLLGHDMTFDLKGKGVKTKTICRGFVLELLARVYGLT